MCPILSGVFAVFPITLTSVDSRKHPHEDEEDEEEGGGGGGGGGGDEHLLSIYWVPDTFHV